MGIALKKPKVGLMEVLILSREPAWSESVAVSGKKFTESIKEKLGFRAIGRKIHDGVEDGMSVLREACTSYSIDSNIKNGTLRDDNGLLWSIFPE